MNETAKTSTFVAAGILALVVGWYVSTPSPPPDIIAQELGKEFFPNFTDPLVTGAEVIDFDPATDTKHDLKVARVDGELLLNPGKQDYPEVSAKRLADVVTAVKGLKKLSVVSDVRAEHRTYGVVDPSSEAELKEGSDGVGKRIVLTDEHKKPVFDLIVGKVDDQKPNLHYVRQPNKDRIYRTEIETAALSSRFDDWVKPDLLSIGTSDFAAVRINDQSIDVRNMQQGGGPGGMVLVRKVPVRIEKSRAVLARNDDNKWQPKKLETFDKEKKGFAERPLAEGEELDASKLSDLSNALKNIKIVDVVKKPPVLAADLQAPVNFLSNPKAAVLQDVASADALQLAGYFPNSNPLGGLDLICHEGDMTVGFADGVQYMLRFGDITGKGRAAQDGADKKDESKPDAEAVKPEGAAEGANTAPNRYLFVTASFNPALVPQPKLTELPPLTVPTKGDEPKSDDAPKADVQKTDAPTPPVTPSPEAPKPATPNVDAPKTDVPAPTPKTEAPQPEAPKAPTKVEADDAGSCEDQEPAKPAEAATPDKKEEPKPAADIKPTETKPAEATPADTKPAPVEVKPAATAPSAEPKPAEEAKPAVVVQPAPEATAEPAKPAMTPEERKRIETENKSKQEKYDADLKAGEEKAKQLNAKFADWFYVVSDATFQGLNVDPTTLVKPVAPPAAAPTGPQPGGFPGLPPGFGLPQP